MIVNHGWTYATINVRTGTYVEANPITVNSGISIVGEDQGSVIVRPQIANQDIFWLNPQTYLYGMTFSGHIAPAAAIQFPATGMQVISDLHTWSSPRIESCTSIVVADAGIGQQAGTGMIADGSRCPQILNTMTADTFIQYNQTKDDALDPGLPISQALTRGGNGIVVKNGASVILSNTSEICCNIGVLCQSGGTASVTGSLSQYGNFGLWADGTSSLQYTCNIDGGGQPDGVYLIKNLPPLMSSYKRPYPGQVVTIGGQYYSVRDIFVDPNNPGSGYNPASPPTVVINDTGLKGPGYVPAQAIAKVNLDGTIDSITVLVSGQQFTGTPSITLVSGGSPTPPTVTVEMDPTYYTIASALEPNNFGQTVITIEENVPYIPNDDDQVNFFQVSKITASSHVMQFVGSGTDIATCIPSQGGTPISEQEIVATNGARISFISSDHLGNFKVGPALTLNQDTGMITGSGFVASVQSVVTPMMIALQD